MAYSQDRLTLDALLADPLTQLVMLSDNITPAEVAQAFADARLVTPESSCSIRWHSPVCEKVEAIWPGAQVACRMC